MSLVIDKYWYDNYTEIVNLGSWLESTSYFNKPAEVIYYFEKPWKYAAYYHIMKKLELYHCPDCGELGGCDCYQTYDDFEDYLIRFEEDEE